MKKLSELFEIKYGSNLELSNLEIVDKDTGIPFVSRTEKNNGISAYVKKPNDKFRLNPKHTLSVALGGTALETFYQDKEYYSGRDISFLSPLNEMTKEEMLYYAICIKANKIKYSYGRQANRTLKNIMIPEKHEIPTWVYTKKIPTVSIKKPDKLIFDLSTWKEFLLTDLFEVERGDVSSMQDLEEGNTPIISSSAENNGVSNYVFDDNEKFKVWDNCLTIANNGSVGSVFYHNYSFYATINTTVLIPKIKISKEISIFLKTILEKQKINFAYGRTLNTERLSKMKIKLPVIKETQEIDWVYIEEIMKKQLDNIQIS